MVYFINKLLTPIEKAIRTHQKYLGYFFLILSLASFGYIFSA